VMITGDAPSTARAIADRAGLPPGPVLCGAELEALSAEALASSVARVDLFARVLPLQKLRLVQALQAGGAVVAMTGDGVNDAAALRAADIGVAMGRHGTAVAREAADLVLLEDSFASLVESVALGRRIESNLHRALGYTLAIHLPIAALSLLPLLLPGQPLLLLPVQIALLHLVIDPACTVLFEAIPAQPVQMLQPPSTARSPLFGRRLWRVALLQGGLVTLVALPLALCPGLDLPLRRSLLFALLLLAAGLLVRLNGGSGRLGRLGLLLALGLWLLLQALPGLLPLLGMEPLLGIWAAPLLLVTAALALLLTHQP